ncbi:hypothetical protein YC2023_012069 [Brassica napus]
MNVLSALILSEEFQGIVSSEAGDKLHEGESSVSPVPSKAGEDSKSQPEDSGSGGISEFEVKNVNSDGGKSRLLSKMESLHIVGKQSGNPLWNHATVFR